MITTRGKWSRKANCHYCLHEIPPIRQTRYASNPRMAVADELKMSEHTLRNHLTTIYDKLGVRGRLELHVFSTMHGLGAATGRACGA
jgi:Bacterial regulatory proteins, luxR family